MRRRSHIKFVQTLILATLMVSVVSAQNEQWLQYRSAAEARQILGDVGYQYRQISSTKPQDVKLPELKSDQPLFMEWMTTMVPSGKLWLAFDTSSGGQYDRLYIDSNANGDLSDDTPYEPYRRESSMAYFGPLKVVFSTADGPVTYHLSAEFRQSSQNYCMLTPAGWYEGEITVGGAKKHCMLVDYNVNGAFNDKSADFGQCDRVRIGEKGSQDSRYVGNYVEVDNKLYKPEIAKDGAFIILTEAADVSYGTVRISKDVSSFSVGGMNGLFNRKPENGVVKLPVGDYRIVSWSLIKNDDKGVKWELRGSSYRGGPGGFTVKSGEEKSLAVGEPVYSKAQYQKSGTSYMFNQNLEGGQGEQIELLRNGAQPPPPKLRIRSRDGTYDRALSFEYG